VIFREAVLSFLGVKDKKEEEKAYCKACKRAKKDFHCERCNRKEIGNRNQGSGSREKENPES
jgi:hypothetical protein